MITIEFTDVFDVFHDKVDAYDFLDLSNDEIENFEKSWLRTAGSKPYVRRLFSTYNMDSDNETVSFDMSYVIDDDTDKDFVIEILALGMCVEWLNPKVNSLDNIFQVFGSKEEKFYSQSQHLKEIRALRDSWKNEQRKLIRDRGYMYNSYIEGYGD